jgi:hypothetical protein
MVSFETLLADLKVDDEEPVSEDPDFLDLLKRETEQPKPQDQILLEGGAQPKIEPLSFFPTGSKETDDFLKSTSISAQEGEVTPQANIQPAEFVERVTQAKRRDQPQPTPFDDMPSDPKPKINIPEPRTEEEKGAWSNFITSIQRGNISSAIDTLGFQGALGLVDYDKEIKPLIDKYRELEQLDPVQAKNWFTRAFLGAVRMTPALAKGSVGGALGAGAALVAGQLGPQVGLPEEIVTVPLGFRLGSMQYWARQGAGEVYNDLREAGVNHDISKWVSFGAGPIYAYIEHLQLQGLMPKLAGSALKKQAARSLSQNLITYMAKTGITLAQEIGEEGLQFVVTETAKNVGKWIDPNIKGLPVGDATQEILKGAVNEMKEAAKTMPFLLAPGAAVDATQAMRSVEQNRADQQAKIKEEIKEAVIKDKVEVKEDAERVRDEIKAPSREERAVEEEEGRLRVRDLKEDRMEAVIPEEKAKEVKEPPAEKPAPTAEKPAPTAEKPALADEIDIPFSDTGAAEAFGEKATKEQIDDLKEKEDLLRELGAKIIASVKEDFTFEKASEGIKAVAKAQLIREAREVFEGMPTLKQQLEIERKKKVAKPTDLNVGVQEAVDFFKGKSKRLDVQFMDTLTLQDQIDKGIATEAQVKKTIKDSGLDIKPSDAVIYGVNNIIRKDELVKDVMRISKKEADVSTVIEEQAELYYKNEQSKDKDFDKKIGLLRSEFEETTGEKTKQSNQEWFSDKSVDYAVHGKFVQKLGRKLREIFDRFKAYGKLILNRANALRKNIRKGKVSKQLINELESAIFGPEKPTRAEVSRVAKPTIREIRQVEEENRKFRISEKPAIRKTDEDIAKEFGYQIRSKAPIFFSKTIRTLEEKMPAKTSAEQVRGIIKDMPKEEAEYLGIEEYLKDHPKVNKEEFLEFIRKNEVVVNDVLKVDDTKFEKYTSPGGENYKELLLTLPRPDPSKRELVKATRMPLFLSPHFEEPNVLSHIRMKDRETFAGDTLFIEEIQSDWHQIGRKKGYVPPLPERERLFKEFIAAEKGLEELQRKLEDIYALQMVSPADPQLTKKESSDLQNFEDKIKSLRKKMGEAPQSPFKKNWHEFTLKRLLRYAEENGYDAIAWTTGETQAERYNLSKVVKGIDVVRWPDKTYSLFLIDKNEQLAGIEQGKTVKAEELSQFVGKDLADKIIKQKERRKRYTGLDLKVGGQGMKTFYDKMIPQFLKKYTKKWGGEVIRVDIDDVGTAWVLPITPEMGEAVLYKGQPTFQIRAKEAAKPETMRQKIAKSFREKTQSITQIKQQIIDFAKDNLVLKDRGKLLTTVKNAKTENDVQKAIDMMNRFAEKTERSNLRSQIIKELKKTKPTKVSGRLRGRFDPEIQDSLDVMRNAAKKSRDAAQAKLMDNLENDDPSPYVALENVILNMRGYSEEMSASELREALAEIKSIKATGRLINQQGKETYKEEITRKKDQVVRVLEGQVGAPETAEAIIPGPATRKDGEAILKNRLKTTGKTMVGWNDVLDMLSFNDKKSKPFQSDISKIAKVSDQETAEKKGLRLTLDKLSEMAKGIYNIKSDRKLVKQFINDSKVYLKIGKLEFTKAQARNRYMEFQDPSLDETFRNMGYTDEIKAKIVDSLSKEDKEFAESQLQFYRDYYNELNKIYKQINGLNLPQVENYSPISREDFGREKDSGDILNEARYRMSIAPGSLKQRTANQLPLAQQSDVAKLSKHINDVEHYKAWALKIRELNSIFNDPRVRATIKRQFGSNTQKVVDGFIDDFTRGRIDTSRNFNWIDKLRVNFTQSVIPLKAAMFFKQMASIPAYAENIPATSFVAGITDFFAKPLSIPNKIQTLMDSELLKDRISRQAVTRDMRDAMRSQEYSAFTKTKSLKNSMMFFTRLGDVGAIVSGGWSNYRYARKQGKSHAEALKFFEEQTAQAQQSSDLSQLSVWQRGSSFLKIATMFMSAPNQYFRREAAAIRNLFSGRISKIQAAKTIAIYHFILPMLFQFVASGFKWKPEDQLRAAIMGSLNGVFILKDILDSVIRAFQKDKGFGFAMPLWTSVDDFNRSLRKIDWEDISLIDVIDASKELAKAGGLVSGYGVKQMINFYEGAKDYIDDDKEKGIKRMMGWSRYEIERNEETGPTRRRAGRGKRSRR